MNQLSHNMSCTFVLVAMLCALGLGCKDEPVTDDVAGSTVHIDVDPKSINELITDEIKITCSPQDLPLGTQNIMFMEMGKEGEHPLVSLEGSAVKPGTDMKKNMQANGHIFKTDNISESYLQLSIKRPFVDDVGVYCCRMFYQNEFGELKMGHVYADVSIENNDKAVFAHLLEKMSEMEKTIKAQDEKVSHLENYTNHLEKTIKDQGRQLVDQAEKASSRFTQLEYAGMNRSNLIQAIMERDNFSSAFSVYGTKDKFNNGETLVFKHFQLNIGNHYDLATGVFTAPKSGLYVFHLFVWVVNADDFYVHLKVNDVAVTSLFAYGPQTYDQSSVSTVVSLNEGDKVWPYVRYGAKVRKSDNDYYTVFNGCLLQLF